MHVVNPKTFFVKVIRFGTNPAPSPVCKHLHLWLPHEIQRFGGRIHHVETFRVLHMSPPLGATQFLVAFDWRWSITFPAKSFDDHFPKTVSAFLLRCLMFVWVGFPLLKPTSYREQPLGCFTGPRGDIESPFSIQLIFSTKSRLRHQCILIYMWKHDIFAKKWVLCLKPVETGC